MGKTRAQASQAAVTLDAGALIALERGNGRMIALLQELAARSGRIRVPAGVVGQVWRDGARQVVLARLLRSPQVEINGLDADLARASGEVCGAADTSDVIDASVVITARQHGDTIVTSDVEDLQRLDPSAVIERI
jgi:predicted nucleic acid-binding protein